MKANKILIAALALSALAACSKQATEPETPGFDGEKSYLNVKIAYTDASLTKATGDDTNPFYYGTADEQAVVSATFFFYNEDGTYNTTVTRSINGTGKTSGPGTENVEWAGDGVVVLTNIDKKPKYMGVVLNAGDKLIADLNTAATATEAEAVVSDKLASEDASGKWTNFVMSSSSYVNGKAYYFLNELNTAADGDFKSSEAEALKASPVVVYVERLASKVELKSADKFSLGDYTVDGTSKELFAKINAWGLNATTKDIYCYKSIDTNWDFKFKKSTNDAGTSWSDPDNFRTYWGKSTNYELASAYYPDSYANSETGRNYNDAAKTKTLEYIKYSGIKVPVGTAAYCRENTNDPTWFTAATLGTLNYNSTFTSILLKATLVDNNEAAVDVINYDGQLYTVAGYENRILNKYKTLDADKYIPYTRSGSEGSYTYTQVTNANFKTPEDLHDGYTGLQFADGSYYKKESNGEYTSISAEQATKMLNYGDKESDKTSYDNTLASYYKGGQMYYTIPIEHLNNTAKYNNVDGKACAEGDYGVVRNHYYSVTVNSIGNLGTAVYDPDEEIIPNDKANQKYYLAAKVNILSWKVVNQSVDL
jgi:hypothetical protein